MIVATSCGGVVIYRGKILLLFKQYKRRYEGWVLPKGTVEEGETHIDTALREVKEEAGVTASVVSYIGKSQYSFSVPDDTVTQAAQLAAYYAETGGGQNIPVDVTPVKQVKKTPAGKPGMVIYHSHRTVVVNPYPDIVVDPLNAEKKE